MVQTLGSLRDNLGFAIPVFDLQNGQEKAYAPMAVANTAIADDCKLVAFWCSTDAYVRVDIAAADADATDVHAPAGVWLHARTRGDNTKVAARQISAPGTIHIMECR